MTTKTTARARPRILVGDYMTRSLHTIAPVRTLADAHELMRSHHIRHLPVLEGGKLVGMVSQRDLAVIESLPDVNPAEVPVEDAMTEDVFVVSPSTPLATVASTMADRKRGSAVVMKADRVVGLFTVTDACRALASILSPAKPLSSERTLPEIGPR